MEKDRKKLIIILSIGVIIYSFCFIPKSFYIGGGSCYQGIDALVIRFILIFCGILNVISLSLLLFTTKVKIAKVLSIFSLAIWIFWGVVMNLNSEISKKLYFIPFLIVNIATIFTTIKYLNNEFASKK